MQYACVVLVNLLASCPTEDVPDDAPALGMLHNIFLSFGESNRIETSRIYGYVRGVCMLIESWYACLQVRHSGANKIFT